MTDTKRSLKSSPLRAFFDVQHHYLQALTNGLAEKWQESGPVPAGDRQLVETFVDAANAKMRAVQGYCNKLRGAVCAMHEHVLQIATRIPPPVPLNHDTFRTDPLVNALFANGQAIDRLFNDNVAAAACLRASPAIPGVCFALVTADRRVKYTLGVAMQGGLLVHDAQQQTVNFANHRLHSPCADGGELNTRLAQYLFDGVTALASAEMAARIDAEALQNRGITYEARLHSLSNPNNYLEALLGYLDSPEKLLSIEQTHFRTSKLGILLEGNDWRGTNEFDVTELIWNETERHVILQAVYTPMLSL